MLLVCTTICSSCEKAVERVEVDVKDVHKGLARIRGKKRRCKQHPDAMTIRHVRRKELGPLGAKVPVKRTPGAAFF